MKIVITRGFGQESSAEAEHAEFLKSLKETLRGYGLPVSKITSERKTGGPITLELEAPDIELREITRSFASFLEDLAMQYDRDVYFDISIPDYGFEFTAAGAAPP